MTDIPQYRWKRRLVQFATLLLFALIPISGLLRIDLTTASFSIFGHHVWWSNFILVFGLALLFATIPVLTYMTIGTVWCGWACPQNLVSEWANNLTYKLLGKRASVKVDGGEMHIAAAKNKLLNWLILGASFLGVSAVLAFIPMLFFYTPQEVFDIVRLKTDDQISPFIFYLFFIFLIFIDIAVIRYFLCDYACLYRVGQRMFKTSNALHITYDASRAADCSKCNYCATTCITDIQPTKISVYDPCINCGECIDACDRLHAKTGTIGLLDYKLSDQSKNQTMLQKIASVLSQVNLLVVILCLIGVALTAWGIAALPVEVPPVPLAIQLKAKEVARVCSSQCTPQQTACKTGSMAACYRAAECRCACSLQQDPSNPARADWQACVQKNQASAARELLKSSNGAAQ